MLKLGRKPAVHTLRTMRTALVVARALDPLGSPPAKCNDYVSAVEAKVGFDWGMLGNDNYGDCVWADTGHSLMLRTANTGTIVVPTADQVLAAYTAHTGFNPNDPSTDNGDDETSTCQYLMSVGFLGHMSDATGSVDPTNADHLKWCNQLFGTCRLGLNLPQSAMDQFNAGQPWDVSGNNQIIGGHDVPIVDYDQNYFYIVTWGKMVPITHAFIAAYCEEAHVELYFDWMRQQGTSPSGFDLDQLAANIAQVC